MSEPFSYICRNHSGDVPILRERINRLRSGELTSFDGIERDIITAGLDLVVQLLKVEAADQQKRDD